MRSWNINLLSPCHHLISLYTWPSSHCASTSTSFFYLHLILLSRLSIHSFIPFSHFHPHQHSSLQITALTLFPTILPFFALPPPSPPHSPTYHPPLFTIPTYYLSQLSLHLKLNHLRKVCERAGWVVRYSFNPQHGQIIPSFFLGQ